MASDAEITSTEFAYRVLSASEYARIFHKLGQPEVPHTFQSSVV